MTPAALPRKGFGSDNHASVHPRVLDALIDANQGHVPSYGQDEWSEKSRALFKQHFGDQTESFPVFNGTAANVLCLRALIRPGQSVLCSESAHLHQDEAAAPEFFTGGKLRPIPHQHGKITVEELDRHWVRRGDLHFAQAAALSLTQPTEFGTVYTLEEFRALCDWARAKGLPVHVDGARLGLAAAALGVSFRELVKGADFVSFGGTKNGLMGAEAVLVLNPQWKSSVDVLRKQAGQLPSKSRYLAAQLAAYLENDLWRDIALHSLAMAQRLHEGALTIPGLEVTRPVQSNAVFAKVPRDWVKALRKEFFFYVWDEQTWECRWMCSWDLQARDIDAFTNKLREIAT